MTNIKKSDLIDPKIVHPEPDTLANESEDGGPPLTWNPKKVTVGPEYEPKK